MDVQGRVRYAICCPAKQSQRWRHDLTPLERRTFPDKDRYYDADDHWYGNGGIYVKKVGYFDRTWRFTYAFKWWAVLVARSLENDLRTELELSQRKQKFVEKKVWR